MRCLLIAAAFAVGCSGLASSPGGREPLGCSNSDGLADHRPTFSKLAALADRLPDHAPLNLRVVLPLRDEAGLDAHLAAMTDPASPGFGKPLTRGQFDERHAPSTEHLSSMRAHLVASGFHVGEATGGGVLEAQGEAGRAKDAFGLEVRNLAGGGRVPVGQPSLPPGLGITAVRGLASAARYQSHAAAHPGAPVPLTPARLRTAYEIPPAARGAGQTIAVITMDGYRPDDVADYCRTHGIREIPRRHVYFGGYEGQVLSTEGQVETSLDLEILNAVAPDAREILVLGARPDDPHGMTDMLRYLVSSPAGEADIYHVSCSWGAPESRLSEAAVRAEGQLLKQLASRGVSVWVASGDLGAHDDGTPNIGVDSPASSPWTIAVGGTSLEVSLAGQWLAEHTWPGSGGGESCFWKAPAWQAHLPDVIGEGKYRRVPDVALAADPARGYAIIVNGQEQVVGGTSGATPAAAAYAAVVDGERARIGKPPLGFWPPRLYTLLARPGLGAMMHDLADEGSNGFYRSLPGRDDATGFGSFRGAALTPALVSLH